MDKEDYGEDNVGQNEPVCVCVSCEAMTLWWWGWIVNGVEEKGELYT